MNFKLLPFFGNKTLVQIKLHRAPQSLRMKAKLLVWGGGVRIPGSCPDVSQRDVTLNGRGVRIRSEKR